MLTSEQIKKIKAEVSPYIRRQMEDGAIIAGFRGVVAAAGGDWAALKAVIKAEIQDEDTGDGKKIGKVAEKAEWTRIYLDLLGIAPNMNEENFFEDHDPETGEVLDNQSTAARKDVQEQPARRGDGPSNGHQPNLDRGGANSQEGDVPPDTRQPAAGTQAPPVDTIQEPGSEGLADAGREATLQGPAPVPADEAEPPKVEASSVPRKQWKHSDPPHRDCLDPGQCGGFSNLGLCQRCKDAAA